MGFKTLTGTVRLNFAEVRKVYFRSPYLINYFAVRNFKASSQMAPIAVKPESIRFDNRSEFIAANLEK